MQSLDKILEFVCDDFHYRHWVSLSVEMIHLDYFPTLKSIISISGGFSFLLKYYMSHVLIIQTSKTLICRVC